MTADYTPSVLVIGVGNALRGDDAAGLLAARAVAEQCLPGVKVIEHSGDGAALIQALRAAPNVILIDATQSGRGPGAIVRLDARACPIALEGFRGSTHAFGVAEAIELARSLNQLPERLIVYGIEGMSFGIGEGLSPAVVAAIPLTLARVLEDIGRMTKP